MSGSDANGEFYIDLGNRIYNLLESKVRRHAIGIGVLKAENRPEIIGSGTLAIINNKPIIITAAHVSEEIEKYSECTIICFSLDDQKYEQIKINTSNFIYESQFKGNRTDCGPDISFFAITTRERESLETVGCVFKNLDNLYANNSKYPNKKTLNFSMGVIGEEVEIIHREPKIQVNVFLSSLIGIIKKLPDNRDYDRYMFIKNDNPNNSNPETFGGVSGAGVWEIANITNNPEEDSSVNFIGIIYYETEQKLDRGRNFIFNGPKSIKRLLSNIVK